VLEEAPAASDVGPTRPVHLLPLSARNPEALARMSDALAEHLDTHGDEDLADVAYTLQTRRTHFAHRRFVVCKDPQEAKAALKGKQEAIRPVERTGVGVVFVFPGQGSQYVGMGRALYDVEPVFRKVIDSCAATLSPHLGRDLRDILFTKAEDTQAAEQALRRTEYTQPSIFAVEFALASLWQSWGLEPCAMVGHSVGEFVAATLAGVFSFDDAVTLVAQRARLMQALPPGTMLSVRAPAADIEPRLTGQVALAASNSPSLCVASGPTDEIEALQAALDKDGIVAKPLATSHAFHSPMVEPAVEPFANLLGRVKLSPPRIPIISTATGLPLTDAQAVDPRYWARHMRVSVRFMEAIRTVWADPSRVLLEVGPRRTCAVLATHTAVDRKRQIAMASLDDRPDLEWSSLARAIGLLWQNGVAIDWEAFQALGRRRLIALPHYPFARERHWIEPPEGQGRPLAQEPGSQGSDSTPVVSSAAAVPPVASPHALAVGQTMLVQLQVMQAQLDALASAGNKPRR
jgi:acyl transferase domain-containing protein